MLYIAIQLSDVLMVVITAIIIFVATTAKPLRQEHCIALCHLTFAHRTAVCKGVGTAQITDVDVYEDLLSFGAFSIALINVSTSLEPGSTV